NRHAVDQYFASVNSDNQTLPSFPTRRSSDLPGLGRSDERRALVRGLLERLDVPVVVDADGLFGLEPVERTAPTVLTPHAGELGRDRKSTRLNSSHVARSYAVFCLKKQN